jgi:hypothetical protein
VTPSSVVVRIVSFALTITKRTLVSNKGIKEEWSYEREPSIKRRYAPTRSFPFRSSRALIAGTSKNPLRLLQNLTNALNVRSTLGPCICTARSSFTCA